MNTMRRCLIPLIVAAGLGALGTAAASDPATNARPVIACTRPTFEFGRLDNTNVVTHTFVLTNAGAAPLKIGDIRASCGCTVATVSRQELEPGGTADLTARLNLAGRRGEQVKTITVMSNDPVTPQLQLWMRGVATVDIGLEPAYVNFGQVSPDAVRETQVELLTRDPAVCITGVSGAGDRFAAEVVTDANGTRNRLRIRTVPPFPSGFTRTDLLVITTHPQMKELRLPVSALVPEPVYVIPKSIIVRGVAGGAPARRAFLIRPGAIQSFTLLGVDVPDDRIKQEIETLGPSNYRVTLTGIPIDTALHGKQVVVRTDARGFERIPIEIRITTEPGAPAH